MTQKSLIIIGAGVAGLSTGCYAQMNGYQTQLFEMHTLPGGYCTAWKRKGYTFDGCIHHLAGAGPGSALYDLWSELGIFKRHTMHFYDNLVQVETPDGEALTLYTDIEKLEGYLKQLSPQDAEVIGDYIQGARRFLGVDLLALPFRFGPSDALAMAWRAPAFIKWGRVTLDQFGERFQHPLLRQAFPTLQYDFRGIPVMLHYNFLAGCHNQTLGWPSGGSLAFAKSLAAQFEELGGELHYRAPVSEILTAPDPAGGPDKAVGVRLEDGTEAHADVVISAADGHATIFDMLGGKYTDERIRTYYEAAPDGNAMNFAVSLGVDRDMSDEPHALVLYFDEPADLLQSPHDRMSVEIYNFEPTFAPEGKTAVKVLLHAKYSRWKELRADRARYNEEKQKVAETVIAKLEPRFPGISNQIEVIDVSTPLTIERFTGNWHGLQPWGIPGAGMMEMLRGFTHTLPGLQNFHMVGQWAEALIGVTTAAISGRNTIKRLCKQEKRPFVSSA